MDRSDPGRCMKGHGVFVERRKFVRCNMAETWMRSNVIVKPPPSFDDHLHLGARSRYLSSAALIAKSSD
jgi:hypothetical protein